ncbi:MAG: HI0074 family nucleotidyltransferase substrate-binding subunit [Armatimonadota bacterium]|nr:HI0074 family nucleotidyltransferase substrate-binding subunit [Armatimonadota bacterium]
MTLDLTGLRKAIDTLRRSINAATAVADIQNKDVVDAVRAGVIQGFEVAYEQCWKFIQRWIRENRTPEDAEFPRTRKELFRLAARYGLVADPEPWFVYGDARNLTSHTYNEEQAISVYKTAIDFLGDAEYLLRQLEAGND